MWCIAKSAKTVKNVKRLKPIRVKPFEMSSALNLEGDVLMTLGLICWNYVKHVWPCNGTQF